MSYSFKSVVLFLKILVTLVLWRGYGCIIQYYYIYAGKSTKARGVRLCLTMIHIIEKMDFFWQHQSNVIQLKCQLPQVNETSVRLENP